MCHCHSHSICIQRKTKWKKGHNNRNSSPLLKTVQYFNNSYNMVKTSFFLYVQQQQKNKKGLVTQFHYLAYWYVAKRIKLNLHAGLVFSSVTIFKSLDSLVFANAGKTLNLETLFKLHLTLDLFCRFKTTTTELIVLSTLK